MSERCLSGELPTSAPGPLTSRAMGFANAYKTVCARETSKDAAAVCFVNPADNTHTLQGTHHCPTFRELSSTTKLGADGNISPIPRPRTPQPCGCGFCRRHILRRAREHIRKWFLRIQSTCRSNLPLPLTRRISRRRLISPFSGRIYRSGKSPSAPLRAPGAFRNCADTLRRRYKRLPYFFGS